jgi:hypothetical protein
MGLADELMSCWYGLGSASLEAEGRQPMSCWKGRNGSPGSKDMSLNMSGRSTRSEIMGP